MLALALGMMWAAGARSEASPPVIALDATGSTCPTPEAVAAALADAMPGARVVTTGPVPAGAGAAAVVDLGPRYRVRAGGAVRETDDAPRRCEERARAAAVMITLALQPPAIDGGQTPAPTPLVAPPPAPRPLVAPPPGTPPPAASMHVELSLAGVVAPRSVRYNSPVTGGGGLRLVVALPHVGFVVGAAGYAPVRLDLARGGAMLLRIPLHTGVFGWWRWSRFDVAFELGAALSYLRFSGVSYDVNRTAVVYDVAVRTSVTLSLRGGARLRPFLSVEALVSVAPGDLIVSDMTVGSAPGFWLGALLGLSVKVL